MSEPIPIEDDATSGGAVAAIVGVVAMSALMAALVVTALVSHRFDVLREERSESQENTLRSHAAAEQAGLNAAPSWVDKAKGLVTLPIDRAMAWTVDALRRDRRALTPGAVDEAGAGGAGGAAPLAEDELSDEELPDDGATEPAQTPVSVAPAATARDASGAQSASRKQSPEPSAAPSPTGEKVPAVSETPAASSAPQPTPSASTPASEN